jgi:hypothetical protein
MQTDGVSPDESNECLLSSLTLGCFCSIIVSVIGTLAHQIDALE